VLGGQVGDGVHDLLAGALAVQAAGVADDPGELGGTGKVDVLGGGGGLDEAFLGAPVARECWRCVVGRLRVIWVATRVSRPGWLALTVIT